jgi:hypothetical protein
MNKEKMTIKRLAAASQEQFLTLEKKMDAGFADVRGDIADVRGDVKLILSAVENLAGQIADVKQSTLTALDVVRLESRLEVVEHKLGIKT